MVVIVAVALAKTAAVMVVTGACGVSVWCRYSKSTNPYITAAQQVDVEMGEVDTRSSSSYLR